MKKRWRFIIIFVLFCLLFYFLFSIAKSYYSRNKNRSEAIEIYSSKKQLEENNAAKNNSESGNEPKEEEPEKVIQPNSFKITVGQSDCDNECSRFKDDDELEYCERICGISDLYDYGDEEESDGDSQESTDCSKKEGIKKDYCLKDLAVEENDFKICNQITDTAIQKSCNNRILEELMEAEE